MVVCLLNDVFSAVLSFRCSHSARLTVSVRQHAPPHCLCDVRASVAHHPALACEEAFRLHEVEPGKIPADALGEVMRFPGYAGIFLLPVETRQPITRLNTRAFFANSRSANPTQEEVAAISGSALPLISLLSSTHTHTHV